jgi:hypothetical protein
MRHFEQVTSAASSWRPDHADGINWECHFVFDGCNNPVRNGDDDEPELR